MNLSELANELALEYNAWIIHPKSQRDGDRKNLHVMVAGRFWVEAVGKAQINFPDTEITPGATVQVKDRNYVLDMFPGDADDLVVNGLSDGDVVELRFESAAPVKLIVSR